MESDPTTNKNTTPLMWSNNECIKIASKDHFPADVKDLLVQKEVIFRYLNIYCGGKKPKGLSIGDLTFAVIAIMPLKYDTEEFLWKSSSFDDEGTLFKLVPSKEEPKDTNIENNCEENDEDSEIEGKVTNSDHKDVVVAENYPEELNLKSDAVGDAKGDAKQSEFKQTSLPNETTKVSDKQEQNKPISSDFKSVNFDLPSFKLPKDWNKKPAMMTAVKLKIFTHLHNTCFNSSVNKLLSEWNSNVKARIVLKYFFGIVALVFLRATTKKFTHLSNTFHSDRFINIISFASPYIKYAAPQNRCIKNSCRYFRKRDGGTSIMFAKIVIRHYELPKFLIFRKTVLNHTMDFGLGIVSMFRNLSNQLDIKELNKIVEVTRCEETLESWNKLISFLQMYDNEINPTLHWARIIDAEYFTEMCCSENYALAVVFAVFTEKFSGKPDIWRSAWVKCREEEKLDRLKELGCKMYEKFHGSRFGGEELERLKKLIYEMLEKDGVLP